MRSLKTAAFPVLLTSVLALFLVVGCADQPVGPVIEPAAAAPMANFMNGPTNPGMSGVFSFQNVFLTFTTDPARDLLAAHFQADDFFACGGGSGFELADIHAVRNQDDIRRAISQLVDAPIFIYQLSTFTGCQNDDFATGWVYSGTHTLRARDNDALNAGPGANAFGWNGHGTVFDQGGNPYSYSEHQQAVILPNGDISFLVEDILVR